MRNSLRVVEIVILFVLFTVFITACGSGVDNGGGDDESNNIATYTIDSNKCLVTDNSETTVNYSNGNYMSKTLVWNCADYENYADQYIELFFTSYDGQCYSYNSEYISESICGSPATAPTNPVFDAKIIAFQISTDYPEIPGFMYSYTIENTGNTTLFNLRINMEVSPDGGGSGSSSTLPLGETHNGSGGIGNSSWSQQTLDITLKVEMWDGTLLDSQTKSITIP